MPPRVPVSQKLRDLKRKSSKNVIPANKRSIQKHFHSDSENDHDEYNDSEDGGLPHITDYIAANNRHLIKMRASKSMQKLNDEPR